MLLILKRRRLKLHWKNKSVFLHVDLLRFRKSCLCHQLWAQRWLLLQVLMECSPYLWGKGKVTIFILLKPGDDSVEGLIAAELYNLLQYDHANTALKKEKGKKKKKVSCELRRVVVFVIFLFRLKVNMFTCSHVMFCCACTQRSKKLRTGTRWK